MSAAGSAAGHREWNTAMKTLIDTASPTDHATLRDAWRCGFVGRTRRSQTRVQDTEHANGQSRHAKRAVGLQWLSGIVRYVSQDRSRRINDFQIRLQSSESAFSGSILYLRAEGSALLVSVPVADVVLCSMSSVRLRIPRLRAHVGGSRGRASSVPCSFAPVRLDRIFRCSE